MAWYSGNIHKFDISENAAAGKGAIIKFNKNGNIIWQYEKVGKSWRESGGGGFTKINNSKEVLYAMPFYHNDTSGGTNAGFANLVIGKLDSNGHKIWEREFGDTSLANWYFDQAGFAMDVDESGNMYVWGNFIKAFQIQPGTTSGPNGEGFLTKFDPAGNPLWSKFVTGSSAVFCTGLVYHKASGSLLCSGTYRLTIGIGGTSITSATVNGSVLIASYKTNGDFNWALSFANGMPLGSALANNVYAITGSYYDSLVMGNHGLFTTPTYHQDFFEAVANLPGDKSDVPAVLAGIDFKMFPNPAGDYARIETDNTDQSFEISIVDEMGRNVFYMPVVNKVTTIPLTSLSNGKYFVIMKTARVSLTKPLIIQH